MSLDKPPLGATPEFIWKENRAIELAGAINRYVEDRQFKSDELQNWVDELYVLLEEIRRRN